MSALYVCVSAIVFIMACYGLCVSDEDSIIYLPFFIISYLVVYVTYIICSIKNNEFKEKQAQQEKILLDAQHKIDMEKYENIKRFREMDIEIKTKYAKMERDELETITEIKNFKNKAIADIKKMIEETEIDFPYYASILADYRHSLNIKYADEIMHKQRPAIKTAEKLRQISKDLRKSEKEKKLLELQMDIYENVFPWIVNFREISKNDIKQIINTTPQEGSEKEYLKEYLSPTEYDNLSITEKYQLALDRYKKKKKTNWQIGIAFERYIGYKYETQNYKVIYYGATMGMSDLGRDVIAINDAEVIVVQCKYWSEHKTIHEKHVFQLYGTMLALTLDDLPEYKNKKIIGKLITSTSLSEKAKLYADKLNIEYIENENFDKDYPCVKCNVSSHDSQKIYHLPFDQQYDRIKIEPQKGECYVQTIAEAEALGFRRAFRWNGED